MKKTELTSPIVSIAPAETKRLQARLRNIASRSAEIYELLKRRGVRLVPAAERAELKAELARLNTERGVIAAKMPPDFLDPELAVKYLQELLTSYDIADKAKDDFNKAMGVSPTYAIRSRAEDIVDAEVWRDMINNLKTVIARAEEDGLVGIQTALERWKEERIQKLISYRQWWPASTNPFWNIVSAREVLAEAEFLNAKFAGLMFELDYYVRAERETAPVRDAFRGITALLDAKPILGGAAEGGLDTSQVTATILGTPVDSGPGIELDGDSLQVRLYGTPIKDDAE